KFTLAFSRLDQAIQWACRLQCELLHIHWPIVLMRMPECMEERDPITGSLLWRGLRVRIGMAHGFISTKKPINTGQADFFGELANTAARVCALAYPGQVLVKACSSRPIARTGSSKRSTVATPVAAPFLASSSGDKLPEALEAPSAADSNSAEAPSRLRGWTQGLRMRGLLLRMGMGSSSSGGSGRVRGSSMGSALNDSHHSTSGNASVGPFGS
ncbi:hypothetical protein DUNSADRAFT_7397, partial [Dunaliella salina]